VKHDYAEEPSQTPQSLVLHIRNRILYGGEASQLLNGVLLFPQNLGRETSPATWSTRLLRVSASLHIRQTDFAPGSLAHSPRFDPTLNRSPRDAPFRELLP